MIQPNQPKIIYTAQFIDNQSKLLQMFPVRHDKIFAHHSTNKFRPANTDGLEVGKKSELKITGQVHDEKCFALLVENPKSENKFPHITISCALDTNPIYAQELLERASLVGSIEYFPEPFYIAVTEGYFDGGQVVI